MESSQSPARGKHREVDVLVAGHHLGGHITLPDETVGVVVFAHGSGSSRLSPRNQYVASVLNEAGIATLLFDLLTPAEEMDRANVFDIDLLGGRLIGATDWLADQGLATGLPLGYFGASTGAAAALVAGAELGDSVAAIVSRGGRPDMAGPYLGEVRSPTLLIVGSRDDVVLELNRSAQSQMKCESQLTVVPGATHLFEEPGALEQVATLATRWFQTRF